MEKTTIYLSEDLKAAVKRAAAQREVPEAEVIRQSIRQAVGNPRPQPRSGLFSSGHPIARRSRRGHRRARRDARRLALGA